MSCEYSIIMILVVCILSSLALILMCVHSIIIALVLMSWVF